MYQEHTEFIIERTKGLPLWRYMDFWKFLNLITTSRLYFPDVTTFGDQYEGRIPDLIREGIMKVNPWAMTEERLKEYEGFLENYLRVRTLVSSWTASNIESFAMWKMYSKEKLGIAIKTSLKKLQESFLITSRIVYIGEVRYFESSKPSLNLGNTYSVFLSKNEYYSFEDEVRCIITLNDEEGNDSDNKYIEIDLKKLIEVLYISPFADKTGLREVVEYLRDKYELDFEIKVSAINDFSL